MKKWNIKQSVDKTKISELSKNLNISNVLTNLLIQRGIDNFDKAKKFFRSNLNDLYDPFLMKDMAVAVERLNRAIQNQEKVLIYGDYDVDGTTSIAMMYSFLKEYLNNINFYVPDRYDEGYGISFKSVEYAAENNFNLVIALDCGIKAVDKINLANKKNVDYIICDHHTPGETLPEAVAVLDPKRADCNYPFKELSGAGVGFKLLQAFTIKNNYDFDKLFSLLDLVAISIASDIVPIIDENRILAKFGLDIINKNPRTGIKSIIETSGLNNKNIIISDIVFKIGPRINAAGRIKNANDSVNVLISENKDEAKEFADTINKHNINRRDLDSSITKQALEIINNNPDLQKRKTTVLYNESWSKGVIGIVASRLIEHYYRPTIIFTKSNNLLTGSARSVNGFDIYEALEKCSNLFVSFGGHKYAAGLSIKPENFDEFSETFEKIVSETIKSDDLIQKINIDSEIEFDEINNSFFKILKQLCPFGPGNMTPVFVSRNVSDNGKSRLVGNDKSHLKLSVFQKSNRQSIDGIAFGLGEYLEKIQKNNNFDLCYTIEENTFMNRTSLQLMVRDIKINND